MSKSCPKGTQEAVGGGKYSCRFTPTVRKAYINVQKENSCNECWSMKNELPVPWYLARPNKPCR
ncbi:hypothetical protein SCLCIDRAFT_1215002 [Scleroderma citrinum Foug A]|uniref:Uncharacterized protein n=1 Tax=Scleroderma citrinum Foug A TaxID=1036808 RepID=A0A0C3E323_9AGAM|nr:hypothetical protein SCLCIDRAFT_1215002 [Scleroderma citrinum Foug A]